MTSGTAGHPYRLEVFSMHLRACRDSRMLDARAEYRGLNVEPGELHPDQPAARSGEVIAAEGRWNEAALRRILQQADAEVIWTEGTLGFSISMNGFVIGRLNRRPRGQPWTASIQGFERWHEPTRIIKHWHYTPVWAVATLREAKRQVVRVLRAIPDTEQGDQ